MAALGKPSEASYDREERARIRRLLLGYAERHEIGVPTLFRRIAATAGRQADDAGLKALQRFLGDENRTNDATLWLYDRFLDEADLVDPVIAFGDAICKFQQFGEDAGILEAVAGAYEVTAHRDDVEGFGTLSGLAGRIMLGRVPDRPYLRASEKMPDRKRGGKDQEFEGVALVQAHGLGLVLRDVLTRRPKTMLLFPAEGEAGAGFSGTATSPVFSGFGRPEGGPRNITLSRSGDG